MALAADPGHEGYDASGKPSTTGVFHGPYTGPSVLDPKFDEEVHGPARAAAISWEMRARKGGGRAHVARSSSVTRALLKPSRVGVPPGEHGMAV